VEVGGIVEFMAEMLIEHWEELKAGTAKVGLRCSYASKFFPKFSI